MSDDPGNPDHGDGDPATSSDPRLQWLLDQAGVRETIARFADTGTRADHDGFRRTWAHDGRWVIGDGLDARGIDEIADALHRLRDGREFFVQIAVPGPIDIQGDEATVTCTCQEAARGPGETYYRNYSLSFDRLQRSGQGWVFTSRSFQYLWLDDSPFTGATFPVPPLGFLP